MDGSIVKFEENFNVKFTDHNEGMKAFIQNSFAEFKKKKMFLEYLCQQEERINILESEKAMFQQQIISLKSVMCTSDSNIKELEQYGRRLCLCIKSMSC